MSPHGRPRATLDVLPGQPGPCAELGVRNYRRAGRNTTKMALKLCITERICIHNRTNAVVEVGRTVVGFESLPYTLPNVWRLNSEAAWSTSSNTNAVD